MNMTDSTMAIAMDLTASMNMTTGMDMVTNITDSTMDMGTDTAINTTMNMTGTTGSTMDHSDMMNMGSGAEAVTDHTMHSGNSFCISHSSHSLGGSQGDGMIMYMDGKYRRFASLL